MKIINGPGGGYVIERGTLRRTGELIKAMPGCRKALIVSDSNVFEIYGAEVTDSLTSAGIGAESIVVPAGESSKSFENFRLILEKLSEKKFSRSDVLAALGGGVAGDLGGFAASCFKRGMRLVQIPTSLLAMVDSSVGGKTGVNFAGAKNQVGSFYEPELTVCDPECLNTLPEREFSCGAAEIIKYAFLFDETLFNIISGENIRDRAEYVIEKCVRMKLETVRRDLRDHGCRQLLNFGHTIGHAAEVLSGYELSHGAAVAAGMAVMCRAAVSMGLMDRKYLDRLTAVEHKYALPDEINFTAEQVYELILSDKKRNGDVINLIMPRKIGRCEIFPAGLSELKGILRAGGLK